MATSNTYSHDLSSHKHGDIKVNVAEIEPDISTTEYDELTLFAPDSQPQKTSTIQQPHGNLGPFPQSGKRHEFRRPSSPTGSVRSSFTSRRRVSRGLSWSSGFSRSHSSEVSRELTVEAESEFIVLMELMSGISSRSSSLKEVWAKIISERESCMSEMDRMYERFGEYTETIERNEKEQQHHHHEHEDRKKDITRLRLEITAAMTSVSEYKQMVTERDSENENLRRQIEEFKDSFKCLKEEYEETKTALEDTQLKLVVCEESRHIAEQDAKKHHHELRSLKQQCTELQTSHFELTQKYETTQEETVNLTQSNTALKKERSHWMHDKGELEESLRKCKYLNDELKRKNKELLDVHEKSVREVHQLQEIITKTKYENEELHLKITEVKRELQEEHGRWVDAEDRCGKWKLKLEHSEREIVSIQEEVRLIEFERTELREAITKKSEQLLLVMIDKERLEGNYHEVCEKADEHHRQILILKESLRRTETTLKEKTELVHTLRERIERIERERDEERGKCIALEHEISSVQASIVSLKLEIETVTEEREDTNRRLYDCKTRYEEICETITEYEEGSSSSEYELMNLRSMLREVREQKEKAITMRNSADRERDEVVVRYEEKCREMERLEESFSQQFHSHEGSRSGGRTFTRHLFKGSRSASTVNGHEYEHGHEA